MNFPVRLRNFREVVPAIGSGSSGLSVGVSIGGRFGWDGGGNFSVDDFLEGSEWRDVFIHQKTNEKSL